MSKDASANFFNVENGKAIVTLNTLKTSGIETVYATGGRGSAKPFSTNREEVNVNSEKEKSVRQHIIDFLLKYPKGINVHLEFDKPIDNEEKFSLVKYQLEIYLYGIAHNLEMRDGKVIIHVSELVDDTKGQ